MGHPSAFRCTRPSKTIQSDSHMILYQGNIYFEKEHIENLRGILNSRRDLVKERYLDAAEETKYGGVGFFDVELK